MAREEVAEGEQAVEGRLEAASVREKAKVGEARERRIRVREEREDGLEGVVHPWTSHREAFEVRERIWESDGDRAYFPEGHIELHERRALASGVGLSTREG